MIILIRHAEATGQHPHAPLTADGCIEAQKLCSFLASLYAIDQIICSPFLRALETIKPLAALIGIPILKDSRLAERFIDESADMNEDKLEELIRDSFDNYDLEIGKSETNRQVQERAKSILDDLDREKLTVLVSHGNFCTVLLNLFSHHGYSQMIEMTRPDAFLIDKSIERLWTRNGIPLQKERTSVRAILCNATEDEIFLLLLDRRKVGLKGLYDAVWITPGGGVEPEENPEDCLKRELFEEVGLYDHQYDIICCAGSFVNLILHRNLPLKIYNTFYLVRLKQQFIYSNEFQTEDERKIITDTKWWSLDDLSSSSENLDPPQLKNFIAFKGNLNGISELFNKPGS